MSHTPVSDGEEGIVHKQINNWFYKWGSLNNDRKSMKTIKES